MITLIAQPAKRIYLAGPISGRTLEEVISRYQEKSEFLIDHGYDVLSPMTGKGDIRKYAHGLPLHQFGYDDLPVSTNHAIFERDKWMVTQADIVFVDLSNSGERISIGTMMELAWGSYLNKHTVVVLPLGNVHEHAFVYEAADIIFQTLEDAYDYFKALTEGSFV